MVQARECCSRGLENLGWPEFLDNGCPLLKLSSSRLPPLSWNWWYTTNIHHSSGWNRNVKKIVEWGNFLKRKNWWFFVLVSQSLTVHELNCTQDLNLCFCTLIIDHQKLLIACRNSAWKFQQAVLCGSQHSKEIQRNSFLNVQIMWQTNDKTKGDQTSNRIWLGLDHFE